MNIFDITKEYDVILYELEENGGELTPEIAEKLAINETSYKEKVRAFYFTIKTKEAEIGLAKDEIARLTDKCKVKENVIKRLKNLVDLAIETFGVVKPKAKSKSIDLGDLSVYQKKTKALELIEDAEIDDARFCRKMILINLSYEDYDRIKEELPKLLYTNRIDTIMENHSIAVDKDKLKEWLIEQDEVAKQPKLEFGDNESIVDAFEKDETTIDSIREFTPDEKIHLVAKVKHNSSPVFK